MSTMFKKRRFSDFTVVCDGGTDGGDREFLCHRAVLAEASPALDAAISSSMSEGQARRLRMTDADASVVEAMLCFLYSGKINAPESLDVVKLLVLADFWGVENLARECLRTLLENLSPDNIVAVTRSVKRFKEKPEVAPVWEALQKHLKESPELLTALMTEA